ncbi:hypothetical protein GCM10023191_087370 [Actinoallomurus oryzae]|uniref:Uncharacterized protein n=1 Tax=Actinoallomurus oryzae TaxID=502180 RepID=A0ABP8R2B6_9ACTN
MSEPAMEHGPHGLALDAERGRLYVSAEGSTGRTGGVVVIDTGTGRAIGRIDTGAPGPHWFVAGPDGRTGYAGNKEAPFVSPCTSPLVGSCWVKSGWRRMSVLKRQFLPVLLLKRGSSMNRIALITGGNRGIGRAAAYALADEDIDIILTYRSNPDEADTVVAELVKRGRTAIALPLDTTRHDDFPAFADQLGDQLREHWERDHLDILVNNAGFDRLTPFGQTEAATIDALFAVHVKGPILLTELLSPLINDGGRILFVSSGLTRYVANPAYSVYASMKGAIEIYTKYAAKILGSRAITVNVIAPGATATDFAGGVIRDDEKYRAMVTANHAFGRVGEPQDIGDAVRAITSASAGWITAQRIEASGGQGL